MGTHAGCSQAAAGQGAGPMAGMQHVALICPHAWLWLAVPCGEGGMGLGREPWGRQGVVPRTPHHRCRDAVPRAPHVPTCTAPALGPHHGEDGSCLSLRPPHPACHRDIAAHHTTHPSDVILHHCSDIPSRAAAISSTAMTLHDIVQQGPHHTPKAPQSTDNTVTSQHPMTSCCMGPSNIYSLSCHSQAATAAPTRAADRQEMSHRPSSPSPTAAELPRAASAPSTAPQPQTAQPLQCLCSGQSP